MIESPTGRIRSSVPGLIGFPGAVFTNFSGIAGGWTLLTTDWFESCGVCPCHSHIDCYEQTQRRYCREPGASHQEGFRSVVRSDVKRDGRGSDYGESRRLGDDE